MKQYFALTLTLISGINLGLTEQGGFAKGSTLSVYIISAVLIALAIYFHEDGKWKGLR